MRASCSLILLALALCAASASCTLSPASSPDLFGGKNASRLQDARFDPGIARAGVWTPWKFQRAGDEGIYFLENHDDSKIPVLFIHGMYGSPRNFRYLIQHLDRDKFQPWLYYYASGDDLTGVAERLLDELATLCAYYKVRSIAIVAHSMGGLIARDLLLHEHRGYCADVPVLITLSTPWDGHLAAAVGARFWPTGVRAWRDLATGSPYIESLFQTREHVSRHLPLRTRHYLVASVGRDTSRGLAGSDQVVSVASQLRSAAWQDSYRIQLFDETHSGVLNSAAVASSINGTLATLLHKRAEAAVR